MKAIISTQMRATQSIVGSILDDKLEALILSDAHSITIYYTFIVRYSIPHHETPVLPPGVNLQPPQNTPTVEVSLEAELEQ